MAGRVVFGGSILNDADHSQCESTHDLLIGVDAAAAFAIIADENWLTAEPTSSIAAETGSVGLIGRAPCVMLCPFSWRRFFWPGG